MKIPYSRILKNPLTLIISAIAAVFFGVYFPDISTQLTEGGKIYIALVQLAVIPILSTSIILALSHLSTARAQVSIKKGFIVYGGILLFSSFLGIGMSLYWDLGSIAADKPEISDILSKGNFSSAIEINQDDPLERQTKTTLSDFFVNIFPANAVEALSKGFILQILTFSVLMGVALGRLRESQKTPLSAFIESLKAIFHNIIDWMILLLPVGIFLIVSSQITVISPQTLIALGNFVLVCFAGFMFLIVLGILCIWWNSGVSLLHVIFALKDPVLISFVTGSAVASMPFLIDSLIDQLKFRKDPINLFVPIGIAVCRHGYIFYYSFAAIFIAQLYHEPLFYNDYFIIVIGSILAGIASASIGLLNLQTMSFILDPMALPFDVVIVLFLAIDTLILPIRSVTQTILNGASAAIVARTKIMKGANE